ncbi:MAG: response regulator [Bdellovibrionaceae bacterium]|nr:response regulator [Pseudobdellovibrionaceae bacterium]
MLYEEKIELTEEQKKLNELANQAKHDFLTSMNHELRTPLNAVMGFCQMLDGTSLDKEQINLVRGIHRSGELLLNLIENILDISKFEKGTDNFETIPFSINELMAEVIDLFRPQANAKNITLSYNVCSEASRNVIGSPTRLRQVLVNLIGNAIKFTSFGQVYVRVESEPAKTEGSTIFRFSVVDTGIGIREIDQHKIFQKFSQAETGYTRRFGGLGLGLALSKQLVHMMNGEIDFESQYGEGSVFWIRLPMNFTRQISQWPGHTRRQNWLARSVQKKKLNIMVVDDSNDSLMVAGLFLKRLGHSCELVTSGADSLMKLKIKPFDLILMDLQMPEMDGCQVTENIRQSGNRIPIIALTANALEDDIKRCYASGMNDYLSKPILVDKLNTMLEKWSPQISLLKTQ